MEKDILEIEDNINLDDDDFMLASPISSSNNKNDIFDEILDFIPEDNKVDLISLDI